jgi:nitrite reductase/ring-hydroxylating ferredoxin subunit
VRHELFPAAEIGPGEMRRAEIGSVGIVIARAPDGALYALRDVCAHMGARLSDGVMHRASDADPAHGGYRLSEEIVISCPWHGAEFAVQTGRCLADEKLRARSYEVREENDMIVVER